MNVPESTLRRAILETLNESTERRFAGISDGMLDPGYPAYWAVNIHVAADKLIELWRRTAVVVQ